ncbi:MAG: VWA domain-containing protein [Gammaproteobacteria bacterium]|nr:VWA domain-containing protein [Gammaproteobacteria bacterium]
MLDKKLTFFSHILLISLSLTTYVAFSADLTELYPADEELGAAEIVEDDLSESADYLEESVDALLDESAAAEDELATTAAEDEALAISSLLGEGLSSGLAKDVVMVLDNSGSMKQNDPEFLATQAVSEFISALDAQTRIAIVIFDQNISLAVPLTPLSFETRDQVVSSLSKVNYKGLFTDSPAAIERAIYELKNNGREEALKSIVFMTDGIVDTGKADVDLEKSKWLKEELAADAADESIKVFGIAFTENADFQLIQSISQQTGGEYYRALQASDLQKVFAQINTIINQVPDPIIEDRTEYYQDEESVDVVPAPVQQPMIIEVPAQAPAGMSDEERVRSTIMIVAAAILFITLLAIVYLLLKRSRDANREANEVATDAFINDINNITGIAQYQLGQKPTMFGRVAGKDTDHLNYLVVPESTIGRRHALIEYKDFGFWISDQGSINGTFINDQLINSEVCLKHGDRIRLHKFEFEFSMPEMDDANATVMSNTQFAGQPVSTPPPEVDAATVLKESSPPVEDIPDLDPEFDITGSALAEPEFELEMDGNDDGPAVLEDIDEDETLIRGSDTDQSDESISPDSNSDSEDETLIPGGFGLQEDQAGQAEEAEEDETLMRSDFDAVEDDDMTIRKETDAAIDEFFDIEDPDKN